MVRLKSIYLLVVLLACNGDSSEDSGDVGAQPAGNPEATIVFDYTVWDCMGGAGNRESSCAILSPPRMTILVERRMRAAPFRLPGTIHPSRPTGRPV